jgi:hypothetical protein
MAGLFYAGDYVLGLIGMPYEARSAWVQRGLYLFSLIPLFALVILWLLPDRFTTRLYQTPRRWARIDAHGIELWQEPGRVWDWREISGLRENAGSWQLVSRQGTVISEIPRVLAYPRDDSSAGRTLALRIVAMKPELFEILPSRSLYAAPSEFQLRDPSRPPPGIPTRPVLIPILFVGLVVVGIVMIVILATR